MPARDSVLQAQLHPWLGRVPFLSGNIPVIFQQTHIDGSFPSFFADALRAAHHMLFPPRDLLFPKLFGTESPEDETGETRPLPVMAPSVPSTPARTASVIALFLGCLGLPWFGFGTCSLLPQPGRGEVTGVCPDAHQQPYCLLCVT